MNDEESDREIIFFILKAEEKKRYTHKLAGARRRSI